MLSDTLRGLWVQSRGGKKVGRPIAFKGDPDDEGLCDDEKRRIKRRIANRESARRVRQKRQDLMEEQQAKVWAGVWEPGCPGKEVRKVAR